MRKPQPPPISFRLGKDRLAMVDAYAAQHAVTRHAAALALIDLGIRYQPPPHTNRLKGNWKAP